MLELASALARLEPRPRRSIAFLAFFGEEKGLLGSRYYVAHPLVPLARTVAARMSVRAAGRDEQPVLTMS